MPRGCFGGFTKTFQEGTKNTSHWHYITLTLMCTFESLAHWCTCWISGENITVAGSKACYLHDGLIDWCQQACTRFKPQILEYFFVATHLMEHFCWQLFMGCLVQVGNGIELEAVGLQFKPYRWCPCGVTWESSRTVVVMKLRRTSALWASRGTWKSWALDRATLLITKSGAGGCDCVSGQDICTLTEGNIWGQVRLSDSEYQAASG